MQITLTQPTVADLVGRALTATDFLGDLTPATDTMHHVANCADLAAEMWEDEADVLPGSVPQTTVRDARTVLLRLADDILATGRRAAEDAVTDALETGDVAGHWTHRLARRVA